MPSPLACHWTLDPELTFLNHGSFGACPRVALEAQAELRARLEREPVSFFVEELEGLFDQTRDALAEFLGAQQEDLAFLPNATAGVNAVLRSLRFEAGDELLTTNHAYNACGNVLRYVANRAEASTVIAEIPIPVRSEDEIVEAIVSKVTPRTRIALISHITSPTAIVLPIERLVRELAERGVDTLVDGAHAPGMVDLSIDTINAAYYTGNCHKWMCAPKGAGFLHVRHDKQADIHPAILSHGYNSPRTDRSRFLIEFDWTGTADPTAYLTIPHALRAVADLVPGGWPEVREHNRALALRGRQTLIDRLGLEPTAPESMIGSIASLRLPDSQGDPPSSALYADPLQKILIDKHRIQVPLIPWPHHPNRLTRISAQLYNAPGDYERYAEALGDLFGLPG